MTGLCPTHIRVAVQLVFKSSSSVLIKNTEIKIGWSLTGTHEWACHFCINIIHLPPKHSYTHGHTQIMSPMMVLPTLLNHGMEPASPKGSRVAGLLIATTAQRT